MRGSRCAREWTEAQLDAFRDLTPLTLKPAVWVINVSEDATDPQALESAVAAVVPAGDVVVVVSALLEEEAATRSGRPSGTLRRLRTRGGSAHPRRARHL